MPPETPVTTSLRISAEIGGRDVALTAKYGAGAGAAFEGDIVFSQDDLKSLIGQLIHSNLAQVVPLFDGERWLSLSVSMGGECKSVAVAISKVDARNGSKVRGKDEISVVLVRGSRDLTIAALTNQAPIGPPASPLVPDLLGKFSVSDLRLAYASRDFKRDELGTLPQSARDTVIQKDREIVSKGFSFSATIGVPGTQLPIAVSPRVSQQSSEPGTSGTAKPTTSAQPSNGMRAWLEVDKALGPVRVRRVGGMLDLKEPKEPRVGLLFDAGLELSSLKFGLSGFGLSLCPFAENKNLRFELDGLDLAFAAGPVEISGALLRTKDEFAGMAMIKAKIFTITGLGAYTLIGKEPSLFIFAVLDADLGGPPFFHVKGLAAGFGYNRRFALPPIEEVHKFPLIEAAANPRAVGTDVLRSVSQAFPAEKGQYWVAAGVKFTSFEMIESFALLSVAFGTEVVISILGLSKLAIPPQLGSVSTAIEPIVYAELALKASLMPQRGLLTVEARLTPNSYVFSRSCKLTGGFAFYVWFQGPHGHEGDFVLTLGGYHPMFKVPPHYPLVPRLALSWQVTRQLRIHGECYFALTPTCLMAGGQLSAVYQDGGLRAWFDLYAHFFISWAPLSYDAKAGVSIGVSYQCEILGISTIFRIELSATAHIWGPPFAGKATITWFIISFTVYFGASREKTLPDPLKWDQFEQAFLPRATDTNKTDPLSVAIVDGTLRTIENNGKVVGLVVNPHELRILVKSVVPSTSIKVDDTGKPANAKSFATSDTSKLGIQPMQKQTLDAELTVTLYSKTGARIALDDASVPTSHFRAIHVRQNVPEAMWSTETFDNQAQTQEPKLIRDVPVGLELRPVVRPEQATLDRWSELDARGHAGVSEAEYKAELVKLQGTLKKLEDEKRLLTIPDPAKRYEPVTLEEYAWAYGVVPNAEERMADKVGVWRNPTPDIAELRYRMLSALAEARLVDLKPPSRQQVDKQMAQIALHAMPCMCGVGFLPPLLTTAEKEWWS